MDSNEELKILLDHYIGDEAKKLLESKEKWSPDNVNLILAQKLGLHRPGAQFGIPPQSIDLIKDTLNRLKDRILRVLLKEKKLG